MIFFSFAKKLLYIKLCSTYINLFREKIQKIQENKKNLKKKGKEKGEKEKRNTSRMLCYLGSTFAESVYPPL